MAANTATLVNMPLELLQVIAKEHIPSLLALRQTCTQLREALAIKVEDASDKEKLDFLHLLLRDKSPRRKAYALCWQCDGGMGATDSRNGGACGVANDFAICGSCVAIHSLDQFATRDLESCAAARSCFRTHRIWLCVHRSLNFEWTQRCLGGTPSSIADRTMLRACDHCRSAVTHRVETSHMQQRGTNRLKSRLLLTKFTCSTQHPHPHELPLIGILKHLLGYIRLPMCAHRRLSAAAVVSNLSPPPSDARLEPSSVTIGGIENTLLSRLLSFRCSDEYCGAVMSLDMETEQIESSMSSETRVYLNITRQLGCMTRKVDPTWRSVAVSPRALSGFEADWDVFAIRSGSFSQ